MVKNITDAEFNEAIQKGNIVVDAYADWCGPCKMLGPVIEQLDTEMSSVTFLKLNVDEQQEKAGEYGIMSIPTLLFFKDGKKIEQLSGFMPKDVLKEKVNQIFG